MICPNCKTDNPEGARFCMQCGTGLVPAHTSGAEPASGFNLDRHIPRELQAKLESARTHGGMAGERRIITILFCDVKGSTAAAGQLDPEEWTEIINGAFERMIRPIYTYEGIVARLMGDAILAFFGAPIAHEDDPQRAVLAALDIQAGAEPYSREVREKYGVACQLRVGIHTGLVVVGEIGSDLRLEYTAIGDAINFAARMEQTAEPGAIQISEETHNLVAPFFDCEAVDDVQIKGKATPVRTFRVLAAKGAPGQLRGVEGLSSPLVGREAELGVLDSRIKELSEGRGAVLAVVGEAGLGKTSLIAAAHRNIREDAQISWVEGHALSYAQSVSYFAWRQVIRKLIGAHENDLPEVVRDKLCYGCECCNLPGGDLPFLEAMLAVESRASLDELMGYEGEALVQRISDAASGYVCAASRQNPLVIVFDDLHWADPASLRMLSDTAKLVGQNPMLFVCMLRPDREAGSWGMVEGLREKLGPSFHEIQLEPLPPEKTNTLLSNLLGLQELPPPVLALIMEKAEGNPFFVEELIRSLIETKQIVRQNSHWQVVGQITKLSLPGTLAGVLGARIDRLPDETRRVLQIASVIGRSFSRAVLSATLDAAPELESHIGRLEQARLVERAGQDGQPGYIFRHALVQDAAYDSMLLKQRRELHRRVGTILEESYKGRSEEYAPLLAYHFHAAGDARALAYSIAAAETASRLYANAEAASHYGRALEIAISTGADKAVIAQLYPKRGGALELGGQHAEALDNYAQMEQFAQTNGDVHLELESLTARSVIYSIFTQMHNPALAEKMLVRALELARQLGDQKTQAKLHWTLMIHYLFSKIVDRAVEHGVQALAMARQTGEPEQLAFVLNDLTRVYTCTGEFDKAYAVVKEARALWRTLDNPSMLADSFGAEAEARFNAGEYDKVLGLAAESLKISLEISNVWGQAYNNMLMGFVYLDQGKADRALALMSDSIRLGDEAGLLASSIGERAELGLAYGSFGAIERGMELARESLAIAKEKMPDWQSLPLAIQVRLHLLNGDVSSADKLAAENSIEPITIPHARYTILVAMAKIELALAKSQHATALSLTDALLADVPVGIRPDIPEVVWRKGSALLGLGRMDEAQQSLLDARSRAEAIGSYHTLWKVLASLAELESRRGKESEAAVLRGQAKQIALEIAASLESAGLEESFLATAQVRALSA
ncbi:MAG TPA: adenylate/guanylate cyclase domain-containing protein [Anaerolineales bacterium]